METPEDRRERKRSEFTEDNSLGELKKRMYSRERKGFLPWRRRRESNTETVLVQKDWNYQEKKGEKSSNGDTDGKGIKMLLLFSVMFFVLAGMGAFMYAKKAMTTVAVGGVDITIEGSTAISSGDILELQVLVTNRNNVPLELADLVVTYPKGTVSPADFRTPLSAERIPLGLVEARSARRGAIRAVILGNNSDLKDVSVELQYRMQGGNAVYSDTINHTALLSTDALSISLDGDTELTPGQTTPITITVKSHANTILHDTYLEVDLPFGFTLEESSPIAEKRSQSTTYAKWPLGSLRPGEERVVQLSGSLDGHGGDRRTITFNTGIGLNEKNTLAKAQHTIKIQKPFLSVQLEQRELPLSEYIAYSGKGFDVTVKWHNNLDVPINDATIAITLGGSALNKVAVETNQGGFYRSVDSLLLWDAKTSPHDLKTIAPGASGKFKFKITPLPQSFLEKIRTPVLSFAVHAAGKRLSEQSVPEVLREDSITEVKIGTDSTFNSYSLFNSSPFGTLGPLPPKVEYETTYAIVWEVSNTTSDLTEGIIRAELPHYVRWAGLTIPANEQIIYNKIDNTLEWNLGDIKAGDGVLNRDPRRVVFALGLVPSATQIGQSPALIRNQFFEATDSFTGEIISQKTQDVDIRSEQDPKFESTTGRVIK